MTIYNDHATKIRSVATLLSIAFLSMPLHGGGERRPKAQKLTHFADQTGITALHRAVLEGNTSGVEQWLEQCPKKKQGAGCPLTFDPNVCTTLDVSVDESFIYPLLRHPKLVALYNLNANAKSLKEAMYYWFEAKLPNENLMMLDEHSMHELFNTPCLTQLPGLTSEQQQAVGFKLYDLLEYVVGHDSLTALQLLSKIPLMKQHFEDCVSYEQLLDGCAPSVPAQESSDDWVRENLLYRAACRAFESTPPMACLGWLLDNASESAQATRAGNIAFGRLLRLRIFGRRRCHGAAIMTAVDTNEALALEAVIKAFLESTLNTHIDDAHLELATSVPTLPEELRTLATQVLERKRNAKQCRDTPATAEEDRGGTATDSYDHEEAGGAPGDVTLPPAPARRLPPELISQIHEQQHLQRGNTRNTALDLPAADSLPALTPAQCSDPDGCQWPACIMQ